MRSKNVKKKSAIFKKVIIVGVLSMFLMSLGGTDSTNNTVKFNSGDFNIDFDFLETENTNIFGGITAYAATSPGTWEKQKDNTWKYKENGVYATGWRLDNNKWYYMNENGVMQANSWIQGLYYVGSDGAMLVSSWTPDGYYVGADGAWIPGYSESDSTKSVKSTSNKNTNSSNNTGSSNIEKIESSDATIPCATVEESEDTSSNNTINNTDTSTNNASTDGSAVFKRTKHGKAISAPSTNSNERLSMSGG